MEWGLIREEDLSAENMVPASRETAEKLVDLFDFAQKSQWA